jgi:hypothetical protein
MSPQQEEKFVLTWRVVCLFLLTITSTAVSFGVYFLVKLNDKIDYSYRANVMQEFKNDEIEGEIMEMKKKDIELDTRQDIVSERLYTVEALVKYRSINN